MLSTCNRMEVYVVCSDIDEARTELLRIVSEIREIKLAELEAHFYHFADEQAVLHLYSVACGLHSLVPGESQIQGQVAEALQIAQGGGYAGTITSALFRGALVAGKRARSETGISRNAASVSLVAVKLAKQLFPELHEACVLLVGSGKLSELAAHHLCDNGAHTLIIINRTPLHAMDLAQRFGATHRSFTELAASLVEADVVISSTTAPRALKELTTRLVNKLLHIPMLRLKEAAAEGQGHVYTEALRYLFDLKEQPDETHNHWNASQ